MTPTFNDLKMKRLLEKDQLLLEMFVALREQGIERSRARKILFNSKVVGDSVREREYIGQ